MGELGGFLKISRAGIPYEDPAQRIEGENAFKEFIVRRPDEELAAQGARCMECGVPFCHNGCPLGNLIPDWNDLVYRGRWHEAIRQLHATNNFPEFTGRLCPAPCEAACVLEINEGDAIEVRDLVAEHVRRTGSPVGQRVLDEWDALSAKFVKVFPADYKRVLAELAQAEAEAAEGQALSPHHDHPESTGGEGFVTTEGEVDEPLVPAADTGASGDAARDGRIAPEAGEVHADG